LQECLADPTEVSGFITLAREQAQQSQQIMQQQQQAALLAGNSASPGLLQLSQLGEAGSRGMSHSVTEDLYDQLAMLAAQRASSPNDTLQQQQQQQFVQVPVVSQGTAFQQWQLPLQGAAQLQLPLQQQQQQQAAACWSLDTESSSRWLLQQRQGLAGDHSPLQQQQPAAAAAHGAAATATNAGVQQQLAYLVPVHQAGAVALSGAQTLLPIAVTADGSGATHLQHTMPAMNGMIQGSVQLLNHGGSSSGASSFPGSSTASLQTLQYVTLLDGQRVLLPVASPGQHVTANVTLSQQGVSPVMSGCYMSPQQQQQQQQPILLVQQQQSAACGPLAAAAAATLPSVNSTSSSLGSAPGLMAAAHLAQSAVPNQQQQQQQQGVQQVGSSSSILMSPFGMSLPMMQLQQQNDVTWQQQQQQYVQCSEPQALVSLMQHCSITNY
jgi:hypothetical protein